MYTWFVSHEPSAGRLGAKQGMTVPAAMRAGHPWTTQMTIWRRAVAVSRRHSRHVFAMIRLCVLWRWVAVGVVGGVRWAVPMALSRLGRHLPRRRWLVPGPISGPAEGTGGRVCAPRAPGGIHDNVAARRQRGVAAADTTPPPGGIHHRPGGIRRHDSQHTSAGRVTTPMIGGQRHPANRLNGVLHRRLRH